MNGEHFTFKSLFLGDQMSLSKHRETREHYYHCFPCYLKVFAWMAANVMGLSMIGGVGYLLFLTLKYY